MPKVIDLPTATTMDDGDYLIMEESTGGTKKIARINALPSQALYYEGSIAANGSVSLTMGTTLSQHAGFALVCLNLAGNALSGSALLFLGRGTAKYKDLIGSMAASTYSLSYSNPTWTITNNSASAMYISIIGQPRASLA